MEAKNKALEVELSEEKQMRQDKEQEVGQLSTYFRLRAVSFFCSPSSKTRDTQMAKRVTDGARVHCSH